MFCFIELEWGLNTGKRVRTIMFAHQKSNQDEMWFYYCLVGGVAEGVDVGVF